MQQEVKNTMSNLVKGALGWGLKRGLGIGCAVLTYSLSFSCAAQQMNAQTSTQMSPQTGTAEVTVLMSGGFTNPYKKLTPQFERTTGIKIKTLSGASQGSGSQTIKAMLERGVRADVVILSREGLAELIESGKILSGSDRDLGIAPLAAAVPSGQPQPDISTSEKLKTALLSTHHIAVPASTSGIFLMNTVFPKLGVADRVKVTLTDRGAQAVEMLSSKQADFAILPTSELMFAPGIDIIGRLPDQEQLLQVFAVAITTQATNKESARQLIEYLTSSAAQPSIKEGGMDLIANRK